MSDDIRALAEKVAALEAHQEWTEKRLARLEAAEAKGGDMERDRPATRADWDRALKEALLWLALIIVLTLLIALPWALVA